MQGLFWRIIVALVFVAIMFALLPPAFRVMSIPQGDWMTIARVAVGGLAAFYVVAGQPA